MKFGSNLDLIWEHDPKLLMIRMARYKWVSKVLRGFDSVLEVGAGCGTLSRIVEKEVGSLTLTDLEPQGPGVLQVDMTLGPVMPANFDAVYALDVLEHVSVADENCFTRNICSSLKPNGVCIIGMPSLESQVYASEHSKAGHVNCKSEGVLRRLMQDHFNNVFLFSMNDELVHTGFAPLAHYRLALCCAKK